jgi:hypothetical protein
MATPSAVSFHNESRKLFRDMAMNKVEYNKKRWSLNTYHRAFQGFPKTSTGSWNVPFGGVMNDNGKPFNPIPGASAQGERLRGGIRDNRNYPKVKKLLQQRARDMDFQDMPDVPQAVSMETLTDEDKYKIRLNFLLLRINDLVETGEHKDLSEDVWREVAVLLANTLPTMNEGDLNDMLEFWDNLAGDVSFEVMEKGDAKELLKRNTFARYKIVYDIRNFVEEMVGRANNSEADKKMYARSWVRNMGTAKYANRILDDAREYADDYFAENIAEPTGWLGQPELEEEGADGNAELEEEEDVAAQNADAESSIAVAPAGVSDAKRRFNVLFARSPKNAGGASDDLMALYLIVKPRSRKDKSRTQVRNEVYYRLDLDNAMSEALREKLDELVPDL